MSPNGRDTLVRKAFSFWAAAGFDMVSHREIQASIVGLMPDGLRIPKKDAHPENWLVDDDDNLVMLDLESSGSCPLLFEVVQLLDDYPWIEVSPQGWSRRIALTEEYLSVLNRQGIDLRKWNETISSSYAVFALLRSVFGLARNIARSSKGSSSALQASTIRNIHYRALLSFLATFEDPGLRGAAVEILRCVSSESNAEEPSFVSRR